MKVELKDYQLLINKEGIMISLQDHFFYFLPVKSAKSEIPFTATTLNLIPGISPLDLPFLPKPAIKT